jgi:hypothetical protein
MVFKKFVPPRRNASHPVSIKRTGTISMDRQFASAAGFDETTHVTLYFDPETRMIGIKSAAQPKEEGAMRLTHRKRVSSVRAHPFFVHFGIMPDRTQRFAAEIDAADGMIKVGLPPVRRRPGRPRKRP